MRYKCKGAFQKEQKIYFRFKVPMPEAIFLEIFSMCKLHDRFSSIYTLRDLVDATWFIEPPSMVIDRDPAGRTQLLPRSDQHKLGLRLIKSHFLRISRIERHSQKIEILFYFAKTSLWEANSRKIIQSSNELFNGRKFKKFEKCIKWRF